MMMTRCGTCGTSWTSLGMTLCPICGARVGAAPPAPKPVETASVAIPKALQAAPVPTPPAPVKPCPAFRAAPPEPAPPAAAPAPVRMPPPLPDFGFDAIVVDPPPLPRPSTPERTEDSWYSSLPDAPKPAPTPPARPERVDASMVVPTLRPAPRPEDLPAPARPLSAPLVLGIVAAVTGLLLPLTAALEGNRVFGVLGFCVCGLLLPLAPVAWIAGLAAERRRREQGLRAERRVVVGRLLGQWGTVLLAAEGTVALILVAALRLGGKFPSTFWAP